jgi:hypothetical protein
MFAVVPIAFIGINSGYDKRRAAGKSEEALQQTSQKLSEAGLYVHFDWSMTDIIIVEYHTCFIQRVLQSPVPPAGAASSACLQ